MWIGYWTPLCESWFQKRLIEIREHRADLKNQTKWAKSLEQYARTSKKLKKAIHVASESYLSEIV